MPGAGGGGDPLERTLERVAKDLRNGLISIEGAARDYGVVARGEPPEIDAAATQALREHLRATRPPAPAVAWQPLHATPPA